MKNKSTIKLNLTDGEKSHLRLHSLKVSDVPEMSIEDIMSLLEVPMLRAKEIYGLAEFQKLPSIGIKFAEDLVSMGYYDLNQLKDKDGARLVEEYEQQKGYWVDPCVEDQFRLVVYYANDPKDHKTWWDFTSTRKTYRAKYGYPKDRPAHAWHKVIGIKKNT